MDQQAIDVHLRMAAVEAIASFTVGIAVLDNTEVGTGTLISYLGKRYVLTAEHVVAGTAFDAIRFMLRPPNAMIAKAAKDATDADFGKGTVGVLLPIVAFSTSADVDIAVLEIDTRFELPAGAEAYDLSKSAPFADWQPQGLDGLSLFVFGFPIENSRSINLVGNKDKRYLGAATFESRYFADANAPGKWIGLRNVDQSKDFLFEYTAPDDGSMHPAGFSGCGVWVASDIPGRPVWTPEPVLLGVVLRYFGRRGLLAAAQMPVIFSALRDHMEERAREEQGRAHDEHD